MLTRRLRAMRAARDDAGITLDRTDRRHGPDDHHRHHGRELLRQRELADSPHDSTRASRRRTAASAMTTIVSELRLADTPTAAGRLPDRPVPDHDSRFDRVLREPGNDRTHRKRVPHPAGHGRPSPRRAASWCRSCIGRSRQRFRPTTPPTTPRHRSSTSVLLNTLGNTDVFTYCTTADRSGDNVHRDHSR